MNITKNDIIVILSFFILFLVVMIAGPIASSNNELREELSIYQNRTAPECPELSYENFLGSLGSIGNQDTTFSDTHIVRETNHWVPGKTKIDTVTTKYVVHISVTEDSK